ncbi:MAG: transposase [Ignavibacteriae bacterium HGW-Ignavibacteriae-1]|jgi:REP element-mobilizing transposase RayT|nr:MAG: transposase [Ignavibacteriae bacterium HGW-Ignavibacteriae-1]
MILFENTYYHFYNRTINEEPLFRSRENYQYFLKKYRFYLEKHFATIAYCLMPTHFHFLVFVKETEKLSFSIKNFLVSYSKSYNNRYKRHGNLFEQHSKYKNVDDDKYLISLMIYIHQNPVRSKLVAKPEEWEFSSYQDYIDLRKGTLPSKSIILNQIKKEELQILTNNPIKTIDNKYWV